MAHVLHTTPALAKMIAAAKAANPAGGRTPSGGSPIHHTAPVGAPIASAVASAGTSDPCGGGGDGTDRSIPALTASPSRLTAAVLQQHMALTESRPDSRFSGFRESGIPDSLRQPAPQGPAAAAAGRFDLAVVPPARCGGGYVDGHGGTSFPRCGSRKT